MTGFDVEMYFYKWLGRTYALNGKHIIANSFENAVSGLKAQAKAMLGAKIASNYGLNYAFAA